MAEDVNRRFSELWEAFKRLQETTPGLEVGAGRYVLIPPTEVRLTGFRARLETAPGGTFATVLVDPHAARFEVRTDARNSAGDTATQWITINLATGYEFDSQPMKHACVMARALLDRLEQALQNGG